jgi:hypothetical protein
MPGAAGRENPSRIADIGGGANPMLAPAFIASAGIG